MTDCAFCGREIEPEASYFNRLGEPIHMLCRKRHRVEQHATITEVSQDGGETWRTIGVLHATERARREQEAYEMHRIQVEFK